MLERLGCTEEEIQSAIETVDAIKRAEKRRKQIIEFPHSTTIGDTSVHLFQDVREELDANPFTDGETVVWTVCAIDEEKEEILLKKAHANWQSRWVTFEEFADGAYEPIFLDDEDHTVPRFGY